MTPEETVGVLLIFGTSELQEQAIVTNTRKNNTNENNTFLFGFMAASLE